MKQPDYFGFDSLTDPQERLKEKKSFTIKNLDEKSVDNVIKEVFPQLMKKNPHLFLMSHKKEWTDLFDKAKTSLEKTEKHPVFFGMENASEKMFAFYSTEKTCVFVETDKFYFTFYKN